MPVFRYIVDDVDASLPFYRALGFKLADRWGPPFAVMKGHGLSLWLSGPGTSARKKLKEGLHNPGSSLLARLRSGSEYLNHEAS
jgi:catechol 2,3-dioxygenase-like lactoylglutathione lyase family enzyme